MTGKKESINFYIGWLIKENNIKFVSIYNPRGYHINLQPNMWFNIWHDDLFALICV